MLEDRAPPLELFVEIEDVLAASLPRRVAERVDRVEGPGERGLRLRAGARVLGSLGPERGAVSDDVCELELVLEGDDAQPCAQDLQDLVARGFDED